MQTLCLGSKGMGKSYLSLYLTLRNPKRVIVDPRKEHRVQVQTDSVHDFMEFFNRDTVPTGITIGYSPFHDRDTSDYDLLFQFLCRLRGYTVFIDEVDQFCNPNSIPWHFQRLVNYQRHYEVDLLFAARRPAMIHRDLTALADTIHFFHIHELNDLQYVKNLCGVQFADSVRGLRERQFLTKHFPDRGPDDAAGTN